MKIVVAMNTTSEQSVVGTDTRPPLSMPSVTKTVRALPRTLTLTVTVTVRWCGSWTVSGRLQLVFTSIRPKTR